MRQETEPIKQLSCAFSNTLNKYNVDKSCLFQLCTLLTCACYVHMRRKLDRSYGKVRSSSTDMNHRTNATAHSLARNRIHSVAK